MPDLLLATGQDLLAKQDTAWMDGYDKGSQNLLRGARTRENSLYQTLLPY
jgi:hypothetical protein